jgi:hypothetical protein
MFRNSLEHSELFHADSPAYCPHEAVIAVNFDPSAEQWTVAVNLSDYNVLVCLGIEGKPVRYGVTGKKLVE